MKPITKAKIWLIAIAFLAVGSNIAYRHINCYAQLYGSGYEYHYSIFEGCKFVRPDGKRFPIRTLREFAE